MDHQAASRTAESLPSILGACRRRYGAIRSALPWLDASYWPDELPAFGAFALPVTHETARAALLRDDPRGPVSLSGGADEVLIWRWIPAESGPLAGLERAIRSLSERNLPLVIRQTDLSFAELEAFALAHPGLAVILESGPRKLLYHIRDIETVMLRCSNLYLSTYNFCNWLGLERSRSKGLLGRLLFGSHAPRFSPDAAMGPIIMSELAWEEKCSIAGNNLRRLLHLPCGAPAALGWERHQPFVTDAHAHNVRPGSKNPFGFPTPDEGFAAADWAATLDSGSVSRIFLIPSGALADQTVSAKECVLPLLEHAPDRFRYMTIFHPTMDETRCARVAADLSDQSCVGLKIHPAFHQVSADDASFDVAFRMASEACKPVVTHSWERSSYNPVQELAHPGRFRKHLASHPGVVLVLGHAGGRPSTLEAVVSLCGEFPRTVVDVSGDYFDNGMIDCLAAQLGPEKMLFGSDLNWVDPRCNLGPILASRLPDEDALKVLHSNASRVFLLRR